MGMMSDHGWWGGIEKGVLGWSAEGQLREDVLWAVGMKGSWDVLQNG